MHALAIYFVLLFHHFVSLASSDDVAVHWAGNLPLCVSWFPCRRLISELLCCNFTGCSKLLSLSLFFISIALQSEGALLLIWSLFTMAQEKKREKKSVCSVVLENGWSLLAQLCCLVNFGIPLPHHRRRRSVHCCFPSLFCIHLFPFPLWWCCCCTLVDKCSVDGTVLLQLQQH